MPVFIAVATVIGRTPEGRRSMASIRKVLGAKYEEGFVRDVVRMALKRGLLVRRDGGFALSVPVLNAFQTQRWDALGDVSMGEVTNFGSSALKVKAHRQKLIDRLRDNAFLYVRADEGEQLEDLQLLCGFTGAGSEDARVSELQLIRQYLREYRFAVHEFKEFGVPSKADVALIREAAFQDVQLPITCAWGLDGETTTLQFAA